MPTSVVGDVAKDETDLLISSDKVTRTKVYTPNDEHLGYIHSLMIDKYTGKISYAIMSFGGFLGMGEHFHPLPWSLLTYRKFQGGYVVDLDKSRLEGAPSFTSDDEPSWADRAYRERVDRYYDLS